MFATHKTVDIIGAKCEVRVRAVSLIEMRIINRQLAFVFFATKLQKYPMQLAL